MSLFFLWEQWKDSIAPIILLIKETSFQLKEEGWEHKAFHFLGINEKNLPIAYCAVGKLTDLLSYFLPDTEVLNKSESSLLPSSYNNHINESSILVSRFCITPEWRGSGLHRYFTTRTIFQILYSFSPFVHIHCFIRDSSKHLPYLKKIGFEVLKSEISFQFYHEKRKGHWLVLNPLNHFYTLVKEHFYNSNLIQNKNISVDTQNELPLWKDIQLPSSLVPWDKPSTLNQLLELLTSKIQSLKRKNPEYLHQLAYKHDLPEHLYYQYFFQENNESEKELAFLFLGREILRQLIKANSKVNER